MSVDEDHSDSHDDSDGKEISDATTVSLYHAFDFSHR